MGSLSSRCCASSLPTWQQGRQHTSVKCRNNIPSYGVAETAYDHAKEKEHWEWERLGSARELFVVACKTLGKQLAALFLICFQVYLTTARDEGKLMSCDSRAIGVKVAALCELTKAFTRYFPLLAIMVCFLVAIRIVLRTRIYYEMLRYGALIDFENLDPVHDPLFKLVVLSVVLAMTHFVVLVGHTWWLQDDTSLQRIGDQCKGFVFYVAPAAAFVGFLAESYDIESKLLPLNKYLEKNPIKARLKLVNTVVVPEEDAAKAAHKDLCLGKETVTPAELYGALVDEAITDSARRAPRFDDDVDESFSISHVTLQTAWPVRLLLDPRLRGSSDIRFRRLWYIICGSAGLASFGVIFFFAYQADKDVDDIRNGQVEDSLPLLIEMLYAAITLWLMYVLKRILFADV